MPCRLEPSFTPTPAPGVRLVSVDDEVLAVPISGRPRLLNSSAALIWSLLDGRASLDEVAADLVATLGLDPNQALADVTSVTRRFLEVGLVERAGGAVRDRSGEPPGVRSVPERGGPARLLEGRGTSWLDGRFLDEPGWWLEARAGDLLVRLRVDDRALADSLLSALEQAVVRRFAGGSVRSLPSPPVDGPDAPLYSALAGRRAADGRPARGLHLLHRDGVRVWRCRSLDRLVAVTVADLVSVIERELVPGPALTGIGLAREGRVVVVDPILALGVERQERRFADLGIERVPVPFLRVEVAPSVQVRIGDGVAADLVGLVLGGGNEVASWPARFAAHHAELAMGLRQRVDPPSLARLAELSTAVPVRTLDRVSSLRAEVEQLLG